MNFRGSRGERDELDINLIPLIDVLLSLIFLAASTSFFTSSRSPCPRLRPSRTPARAGGRHQPGRALRSTAP